MGNERQKGGFNFEDKVISDYGLIPETNYIGEWDAYTKDGVPVQIKSYKENSEIDLGSLKRNLNKDEDFYLVIASHKGQNYESPKTYYCKADAWRNLFNDNFYQLLDDMENLVRGISNSRSDDKFWKEETKSFKEQLGDSVANVRFKRDHKTQKRLQCAIPNRNKEEFFNSLEEVENLS